MKDHECLGAECSCHAPNWQASFIKEIADGIVEPVDCLPTRADDMLAKDELSRSSSVSNRRILIKGATVLSMDKAVGDYAEGDILIEGSKILAVGVDLQAADAIVMSASDMIAIPGFCDPHIHCWEGSLPRLIPDNTTTAEEEKSGFILGEWPTRNYRWVYHQLFGPIYRPDDVYVGTLMSLLAAVNGGITTVCDNMHNSRSAEHSDASICALRDSGIRGVHAYGRPRDGIWDRQFPQDAFRIRKQYFSSDDQLTTMRMYMLGRDPYEEMLSVLKIRKDLDLWITFDSGIGSKPVADLYASGRFDGRETINHGNFVSPEARAEIVRHGAKVNVCPRIESQFRYGDVPYQEWLDSGLKPAISNDDPATYAIDMFREMQTLYGYQRAKAMRSQMEGAEVVPNLATLRDMLEAATIRGAENCALDHITGSLTPGKAADIVLINVDDIHLYPRHNAICTVVQGATVNSVDTVFVNGKLVKWKGRLVDVNFARLKQAVDKSRDYLFSSSKWPHPVIDIS